MSLVGKLASAASAGSTFALNFWPWLLGAALAGAAIAATPTFLVTRAVYERKALKLEVAMGKVDTSIAQGNEKIAKDVAAVTGTVMGMKDEQSRKIDRVASAVDALGRRVQLCATQSDLRIAVTPSGSIEAVPDEQLRDLAEAVREFAQACAKERDRDAVDHNALVDWLEQLAKQSKLQD
jgi:HAMP domain-containing protein